MAVSPPFNASAMQAFDQANAQALRRLWFLGDVHGEFSHIATALDAAQLNNTSPSWLVFLGDVEVDDKPFREHLQPLRARHPRLKVAFIHGNHDADTREHWACLHDCGEAVALHARVVDLDGVRVAGIGGDFQESVWTPPAEPIFENKTAAIEHAQYGWRAGQRPNPKLQSAIYPDDTAMLAKQSAHILITHEAPSCHPHGWAALDKLARDMRVVRTFHGHTHDDLTDTYALERAQLGFDARAVSFCCIKNGLGEFISGPPPHMEGWS